MEKNIHLAAEVMVVLCILVLNLCMSVENVSAASSKENNTQATIAVLSHTDFLPDATGVYDRRSWDGRDKHPGYAGAKPNTTQDQAYNNVDRPHGYDPEAVGLPEILGDAILEKLTQSKRFLPVERKALRTSILEQRFGEKLAASYMDRTLDKAIEDMGSLEIGVEATLPAILKGAKYNDLLHDFKDLGTAVGADYLVVGNIHQLGSSITTQKIPLSESGRTLHRKMSEARLRLRVINAANSTVVGADSLNITVSSMLFSGGPENRGDFEFMDSVASSAAAKILDMIFPATVISVQPLIISRGANDGVVEGNRFQIVRDGKALKESSGVVIGHLKKTIGEVEVTDVQGNFAVVTPITGEDFKTGDLALSGLKEKSRGNENATFWQAVATPLNNAGGSLASNLPRIAVGLVKTGSTAKTGKEADKHIPIFTDTLITRLVQTRRFTIIDRQELDQLLDEQMAQAIAANRDMPSGMGALHGCDYLVLGSLQNFSMDEQSIQLPGSTRVMQVFDGFAEGNMRLVDARSGDVMESRKIIVQKQLDNQASENHLIAELADQYASEVVADLVNAVYPIKVAAVSDDGVIYLNRGNDGLLNAGSVLDVFRTGQKIIDPDTGVELGSMEHLLGQIQLTSVEENRSMGRMIYGEEAIEGNVLKLVRKGVPQDNEDVAGYTGALLPGTVAVTGDSQISPLTAVSSGKPSVALTTIRLNTGLVPAGTVKALFAQQAMMDKLTDNLVDALAKSNRFTMMERRETDQLIDEKSYVAIAKGGDIRDYLKELEGSDYLVIGELTSAYLLKTSKDVPYIDQKEVTQNGIMEGNLRIVDAHSSRIIATDTFRIKEQFKNLAMPEIRTRMIDAYVKEAAAGIVQRLYPIKILEVLSGGQIFLNRGADADIAVGSTFTVQRPGEELIDPDTGISFGVAETPIGMLRITQVETARSRAEMVTGSMPARGDILRNSAPPSVPKPKEKMKISW
ncbi:CsgG/HfaB family protein [Desulfosediminicola flagellatus]|uniref:CsgG/HfaB family protein n=1 Tax=Desulfosediminicola flagellatus TaxID=2569541 RepID=UPI0010ACE7C5|nr:CsgG/HfaB family protein [Desulfosediminicola flagellatus]